MMNWGNFDGFIINEACGTYLTYKLPGVGEGMEMGSMECRRKCVSFGGRGRGSPRYIQRWKIIRCFDFPYFDLQQNVPSNDSKCYYITPVFEGKKHNEFFFLCVDDDSSRSTMLKKRKRLVLYRYHDFGSNFQVAKKGLWDFRPVSSSDSNDQKEKGNMAGIAKYDEEIAFAKENETPPEEIPTSIVIQVSTDNSRRVYGWDLGTSLEKHQTWIFQEYGSEYATKTTSLIDITSLSKPGVVWIPSDCVRQILSFIHSPLTLLLLRQINQQFFLECSDSEIWYHQILLSMTLSSLSQEKITKNLEKFMKSPQSKKNPKNVMGLFFMKYFPLERKVVLRSNKSILEGINLFYRPIRHWRDVGSRMPKGGTIPEYPDQKFPYKYHELEKCQELYCRGCEKRNVNVKEIEKELLEAACYTYMGAQYSKEVSHVGYCSVACFRKDLVQVNKKERNYPFDVKKLFSKISDAVKDYFNYEKGKQFFALNQDDLFQVLERKGKFWCDQSFGGPEITCFYKIDEKWEKKILELCEKKERKYKVGLVNVYCWSRMGIDYTHRLIYYLYRPK